MKAIIFSCLFFCLVACQAKQESASSLDDSPNAPMMAKSADLTNSREVSFDPTAPLPLPETPIEPSSPTQANTEKSPTKPIPRQIIRNADISFQVKKLESSTAKIEGIVKQFSGIVTLSEQTRGSYEIRQNLTLRIPAEQLDSFLVALLEESIYTERKTVTAEDVTKRYVDLEARIKAKKITEEKYLDILKKARTVEEVLQVEQQLGQMREEIESREAQLRELKNDVATSTVQVSFYQKTEGETAPDEPFYAKIWNSFLEGFDLLSGAFLGFFYLLPVLVVLGGGGWWLVRWWRKRRKSSK